MTKPPGTFEIKDADLAGRIGRLYLKNGVIETPAFFPVIDIYRQDVPPNELLEIGFKQAITNAYLTLKRFGEEAVEKGIHGIIGFKGVVMTDSGAYQMLEYGEVDVDQETIIDYQKRIGSDIGVILDVPTGIASYENAKRSVVETGKRAEEAVGMIKDSDTVWVLPVQGAGYSDLTIESAEIARRLSPHYGMLGIGGLTSYMEKYDYLTVVDMIHVAKRILPGGKPVHLFGAGHPLIITLAIALGVDTFDSASYILYARDNRYITDYGVERLDRLEYFPCTCPVCSRYTPRDLLEMNKEERTRLLAIHNLYAIKRAIDRAKQAIREGRLWELLEEVSRKHPSAYEAFRAFRKYKDYLALSTPYVKGVVRGLRLYGEESLWRPKILLYRRRLEKYLSGRRVKRVILKPYPVKAEECPRYADVEDEVLVAYYAPYLGIIPRELCGVYPTIHFNYPEREVPESIIQEMIDYVASLVKRLYPDAEVTVEEGSGWREKAARILRERLS
ncbi:MAG: tRNA guanosine(15) transglycosylase TgtA [Crenarchaeota archaeon]|nr:tRNA guanosine(15) transglycosylase TgtA [Thermoproteota archaeon]